LKPIDSLISASRRLGADPFLVLEGGGNVSAKFDAKDYRGRPCRALAVKASGARLKTLEAADLAWLDLEALL